MQSQKLHLKNWTVLWIKTNNFLYSLKFNKHILIPVIITEFETVAKI